MAGKTVKKPKTYIEDHQNQNNAHLVDPVELSQTLIKVSQEIQPLLQDFFSQYKFNPADMVKDPMNMQESYIEFLTHLWDNPQKLFDMQMQFWTDWAALCQDSATKFMGGESDHLFDIDMSDKRFKSAAWSESAYFDFIKQSYLLTGNWLQDIVNETEGIDEETRNKMEFQTKQFIDAISPTNFLFTNPDVLKETIETGGDNLIKGMTNLLEDLKRGHGELKISTTNYEAFEIGENLALTEGNVIYQNELMQLIQYKAETKQVYKRPLLIVPPWINKFYILDLKPENSFIKYLVEKGHTVFTISWVNPDKELSKKSFDDYMKLGILDALKQVETITGEKDCNLLGYCLGGTLQAITLSYLQKHGQEDKITCASFLTTLIDFELAGDMKLFIDDAQLEIMNKEMSEKGFLPASSLKQTFSLMRANDLIWSFVINNYLMGKEPFPFDLLYWNDDATNMPAAMHSFYLRKFYRDNLLAKKDGVSINDTPIDISKINTPCYFLSTKDDHIAPWKATYSGALMTSGDSQFTLAASGHVAGVINPPEKNKYCYWSADEMLKDPDQWLKKSEQHDGSWWPHWHKWIKKHSGVKVDARKIGGGKLKPIESAPGSYVKTKAD